MEIISDRWLQSSIIDQLIMTVYNSPNCDNMNLIIQTKYTDSC